MNNINCFNITIPLCTKRRTIKKWFSDFGAESPDLNPSNTFSLTASQAISPSVPDVYIVAKLVQNLVESFPGKLEAVIAAYHVLGLGMRCSTITNNTVGVIFRCLHTFDHIMPPDI